MQNKSAWLEQTTQPGFTTLLPQVLSWASGKEIPLHEADALFQG